MYVCDLCLKHSMSAETGKQSQGEVKRHYYYHHMDEAHCTMHCSISTAL